MFSSRALLAILLSLALFVQGVAASTMRSCHMRSAIAAHVNDRASHHDEHDASDDMSMAAQHHEHHATTGHNPDKPDKSKSFTPAGCASCAACCMGLALPASSVTSPEIFIGATTVFAPLAVAPPTRLPGGWDRPPRT